MYTDSLGAAQFAPHAVDVKNATISTTLRWLGAAIGIALIGPGIATIRAGTMTVSPDRNLQLTINTSRPGDVLILADGAYAGPISFAGKSGITVIAEHYGQAYIQGGQVSGGDHITLKGLVIQRVKTNLQQGAVVAGPDWRMEDCLVRDNESLGVSVGPGCYLLRVQSVHNGYMGFGCGGDAVFRGPTLKDCVSARNNTGLGDPIWKDRSEAVFKDGKWFVNPTWEAGGGKFCFADGLVIDGLKSCANVGPGIWLDVYDRKATIRNCESYGNRGLQHDWQGAGIAVEICDGPTLIENNYCHDNTGSNLAIWESKKVTARNNIFVGGGVEFRDLSRGDYRCEDVILDANQFFGPQAGITYWKNLTPRIRLQRRLVEQNNRMNLDTLPQWKPLPQSSPSTQPLPANSPP